MVRLVSLAALVFSCATLAAAPALAGKPGGGGGGGTSNATVSASPNPASANSQVTLSGCGYAFAPATVLISHNGITQTFMVSMCSSGCLDGAYFATQEAGTYSIQVYQTVGTKRQTTSALMASTTLAVR